MWKAQFDRRTALLAIFFQVLFTVSLLQGSRLAPYIAANELISLEQLLLPSDHPLQGILPSLLQRPEIFDTSETLVSAGFIMKWEPLISHGLTILVAGHSEMPGYLIKKYRNNGLQWRQRDRYLARIKGARKIADYIQRYACQHLTVPKKWLYRLPPAFDDPWTGAPDYLLIVEELDICKGGWWGGETLERYRRMDKAVLTELCLILHDLKGCDAWPQNQPFTLSGKIAFVDTEHLGVTYGDFLERTIQFIPNSLVDYAFHLWQSREWQAANNLY